MKLEVIVFLLIPIVLYSSAFAAESKEIALEFATYPEEPQNFQPFYKGNQPAKVVVNVKNIASGKFVNDVWIDLSITHIKGMGILTTGFPYLEGKKELEMHVFVPDGKLEFDYIFPVRGNYEVEVVAYPSDTSGFNFNPTKGQFRVHAKEPFYEIRNSAILVLLLLIFGIFLGRVYGRAKIDIKGGLG